MVRDAGCCRSVYMVALVWEMIEKDCIQDIVGSIHQRTSAIQSKVKSVV